MVTFAKDILNGKLHFLCSAEQQQDFISGRGTTDEIYIVKCIHQITDKMKKPSYALFIDLTKAFDHVDRDLMFKTVSQRLVSTSNTKLIQLIESLYLHTATAIAQTPDADFVNAYSTRQTLVSFYFSIYL